MIAINSLNRDGWRAVVQPAHSPANLFSNNWRIYLMRRCEDGVDILGPEGQVTHLCDNEEYPSDLKPTMEFAEEQGKALFDALWETGMRPTDVRYEREVELLKDHLSDLQKLVFESDEVKIHRKREGQDASRKA